jgi:hypothetical protein
MRRFLPTTPATQDPEPATASAKNTAAGPSLTNHSTSDLERKPMVGARRVAVGSTEDRLAVYATPEPVTYEPHALNALIATVAAREVAGRLRERAAWHRQVAALLAAVVANRSSVPPEVDDLVQASRAAWHRIEAAELDALAERELAGGGSR